MESSVDKAGRLNKKSVHCNKNNENRFVVLLIQKGINGNAIENRFTLKNDIFTGWIFFDKYAIKTNAKTTNTETLKFCVITSSLEMFSWFFINSPKYI